MMLRCGDRDHGLAQPPARTAPPSNVQQGGDAVVPAANAGRTGRPRRAPPTGRHDGQPPAPYGTVHIAALQALRADDRPPERRPPRPAAPHGALPPRPPAAVDLDDVQQGAEDAIPPARCSAPARARALQPCAAPREPSSARPLRRPPGGHHEASWAASAASGGLAAPRRPPGRPQPTGRPHSAQPFALAVQPLGLLAQGVQPAVLAAPAPPRRSSPARMLRNSPRTPLRRPPETWRCRGLDVGQRRGAAASWASSAARASASGRRLEVGVHRCQFVAQALGIRLQLATHRCPSAGHGRSMGGGAPGTAAMRGRSRSCSTRTISS